MWGFFNITFEVRRKKEADRKEKRKQFFLKNYILPQQNFGVGKNRMWDSFTPFYFSTSKYSQLELLFSILLEMNTDIVQSLLKLGLMAEMKNPCFEGERRMILEV